MHFGLEYCVENPTTITKDILIIGSKFAIDTTITGLLRLHSLFNEQDERLVGTKISSEYLT